MTTVEIRPFDVDENLRSLQVRFPDSDFLKEFIRRSNQHSREIFVRQWLTEGEPFAFRGCPAIFEELRGWLGSRLDISPKTITLLGSARLGYSLAPMPKYGTPFSAESDLDLAVVACDLYQAIRAEFGAFEADYKNNRATPRNTRERSYWDENIRVGNRNLRSGFFDVNKIPYWNQYRVAQLTGHTMWLLCRKLSVTTDGPRPRKASLRVYRDWEALIDRVSQNLQWALSSSVSSG
jgi:hypothetical protein